MADPKMISAMMELYLERYPSAGENTIRALVFQYMKARYNYDGRNRIVFDNGFEPEDLLSSKAHKNSTLVKFKRKHFLDEWKQASFTAPLGTLGSSPRTFNVAEMFCE
jgi:hypothetical protein